MRRRAPLGVLAAALALLVTASTATAAKAPRLFVNGDSLAVGTKPYLPGLLPGWGIRSSTAVSRHAYEGPPILRRKGKALARIVVVSLGTNDDPRQVEGFRQAIADTMEIVGARRCVIWANVVRPPYAGVSYRGYNRALAREDAERENLRIVNWVRMVRRHPEWLADDGVHVSADGYRARAKALARAAKACRADQAR